ncbi:hypothetical protein DY000_02053929 [Brassica cretica]|uniref:Exocyst subunit Exo70 family protein n=1 Tax=Brassica cretica TaxID=69181 RepID=A0ABQ7AF34_BRACR|nr:hypothetical protein DY000_02053929 [Brassica cretica]
MVLVFHSFKGFSDLRQTLKDFLEDSRKISWKTLGKSSNAFYARRLLEDFPQSLQEVFQSLLPQVTLEDFSEDSWKILVRLLENSRKTLGRLLGKSYNVFYGRRFPTKSSGSFLKSSAQSGTKE